MSISSGLVGDHTFAYDPVGRITEAVLEGYRARSYEYDAAGNLTRARGADIPTSFPSNHLTASGVTYDGAGNLTAWNGFTLGYDPFNQLTSSTRSGANLAFAYTASGERVLTRDRIAGTALAEIRDPGACRENAPAAARAGIRLAALGFAKRPRRRFQLRLRAFRSPALPAGAIATLALVGFPDRLLDGKVLREVSFANGSWSWKKDHVYRDGLLLASIGGYDPVRDGWQGVRHYHLDHLGSPRVITNRTGERVQSSPDTDLLTVTDPFGLDLAAPLTAERLRFTGHERDYYADAPANDDLDYMHARYYTPQIGRFLSTDPVRGNPRTPQSWNLYAYVRNRPLTMVDPTGLLAYIAKVLGNEVKVHIDDGLPMQKQLALKKGLDAAFAKINKAAKKLTTDEKKTIGNIRSVDVLSGGSENKPGFVNESTGAFSLRATTVDEASPAYLGSTVAHDGMHVELFKLMGKETSRGRAAEEQCLEIQLGVGRKIGLSADEQSYLQYLITNPEKMDPYIWAPVP